jgi:hypothetical protein
MGGSTPIANTPEAAASRSRALEAILLGGLAAGVGDAILAVLLFRAPLVRIFQSIASGLLGRDAYEGGLATAALGVALHFFIAATAAAVYYAASRRLPVLVQRAVLCGLAFGVAVYLFMNYVVVPLSAVRRGAFSLRIFLSSMAGHALLVGLPIALIARRASSPSR